MSLYSTKFDQFYRFIGAGKFLFSFLDRFIGEKILVNKIVSLYSIFFSKIVFLYRFKRYIFEYRCPPLVKPHVQYTPLPVGGGGGGGQGPSIAKRSARQCITVCEVWAWLAISIVISLPSTKSRHNEFYSFLRVVKSKDVTVRAKIAFQM
jgi:hypothetical protein